MGVVQDIRRTGGLRKYIAHVYIYNALYQVTNKGTDIFRAQCIFAVLYLSCLSVVMACYRMAKLWQTPDQRQDFMLISLQAPPYIFPLLILSKRLHSIFLLRLFNDCFAVLALFVAIYFYQRRIFTIGSVAYSFGVGTKMSLLLAAPAVGIILLQALPFKRAINGALLMGQLQFALALPFLLVNLRGYIGRSFDLGRVFLFKWTTNWRFIGEQRFLSREFAVMLLVINVLLLAIFIQTRWLRPSGLSVPGLLSTFYKPLPSPVQQRISLNVKPDWIMKSILTSMAIGMLCARSLHYQFYAHIAWSTPFLLHASGLHPVATYAAWAAQEWAWNVYPSTDISSMVVVGSLAVQVFGVWVGSEDDLADTTPPVEQEHGHLD